MNSLDEWKDQYLNQVGVPPNFPSDWDFISCVTACESFVISVISIKPVAVCYSTTAVVGRLVIELT